MNRTIVGLLVLVTASSASAQGGRALREALLAQDRLGVAAALDSSALVLLEGAPILGGAEALRWLDGRFQWQPLSVLVADDGSLGMTYGVTAMLDTAGGGLRFGKYLSVWRRRGEAWRIAAHVQNGLPLKAAPVAALGVKGQAHVDSPFAAADVAFARMAADSGAAAAFAAYAAPTAVTFPPTGEILVGPAAIRARMLESRARSSWRWAPRFAGASTDGGLGFTVGEAVIASVLDGATSTFYSKYLTVWRRMPDGSIRFLADAGNARPEQAP